MDLFFHKVGISSCCDYTKYIFDGCFSPPVVFGKHFEAVWLSEGKQHLTVAEIVDQEVHRGHGLCCPVVLVSVFALVPLQKFSIYIYRLLDIPMKVPFAK